MAEKHFLFVNTKYVYKNTIFYWGYTLELVHCAQMSELTSSQMLLFRALRVYPRLHEHSSVLVCWLMLQYPFTESHGLGLAQGLAAIIMDDGIRSRDKP